MCWCPPNIKGARIGSWWRKVEADGRVFVALFSRFAQRVPTRWDRASSAREERCVEKGARAGVCSGGWV